MSRVAQIRSAVLVSRRDQDGSWSWTVDFLERADRQFHERWSEVTLSGEEALGIVLPAHAGERCKGDRMALVPPGGATVRDTAAHLRALWNDYERENPTCWSRIARALNEPVSSVILTTAPLDHDEYRDLTARGRFYHLDGFHRLVAWAYDGRLDHVARVEANVAGTLMI